MTKTRLPPLTPNVSALTRHLFTHHRSLPLFILFYQAFRSQLGSILIHVSELISPPIPLLGINVFCGKKSIDQGCRLTLYKSSQHFTTRLQQGMAHDNLEKLFQPGAPSLNHVIAEAVRKHLAGQRGNGHASALALENVAKVLKVGVAAVDAALAELECGDVGAAEDLVIGVHGAADAVRSWVADLSSSASAFRDSVREFCHSAARKQYDNDI